MTGNPHSKPIEDYGLIGDGRTVALVARDGAVDWLCWPRFDSDACFAALLGTAENGTWQLAPAAGTAASRRYRPDTLILETELEGPAGRARISDFMPLPPEAPALVRRVKGIEGTLALTMRLRPRFGYGDIPLWWGEAGDAWCGVAGPDRLTLRGPGVARDGVELCAAFSVAAGKTVAFVLQHNPSHEPVPAPLDVETALGETAAGWTGWIAAFDKPTDWPEAVRRSLLMLRALTFHATGGIVAAPTLGLPEKPGGSMNWDYRYCWLRDSTFTLTALLNAGYHEEAGDWLRWLLRAIAGAPDKLKIMYRIDGGRRVDELELPHLAGWGGASPVRLGNAAAGQRQLDVFGEVLDSTCLADRAGLERGGWGRDADRLLLARLVQIWREPDQGMWESRSAPKHNVYSKVMAWVTVDRELRLDGRHHHLEDDERERLERLGQQMHDDICGKGFDRSRGTFTSAYGGGGIDASLLLLPLVGFLPVADPRIGATIAAIEDKLMEVACSGGRRRRGWAARRACSSPARAGWPTAWRCRDGRPRRGPCSSACSPSPTISGSCRRSIMSPPAVCSATFRRR